MAARRRKSIRTRRQRVSKGLSATARKFVAPTVEALETRINLAYAVTLSGSSVTFQGDVAGDNLTLDASTGGLLRHNLTLAGNLTSRTDMDSSLAGEQSIAIASLGRVTVYADGGNDQGQRALCVNLAG